MNDVTKDLLEALLKVARMAEDLKKPCGTDPESPQAIRNAQYMNISYAARAAIARAEAALAEPDSLHAGEPVAAWSDEDRARLRKALDAALQRPPARDDVIRMAREAGFTRRNPHCDLMVIHSNGSWVGIEDELTRLIAIVAAEEREACIAIAKEAVEGATISKYATSLEVLAARGMAAHLIDAIRARGQA